MTSVKGGWARYGIDAATALRIEISRLKAGEPLCPVTVVVPSNQVGVSTRRLLASGEVGSVCGAGPGLIGVTFVTPYRLAELLGASALAAQGRRPVSTPILGAAVRHALNVEPGAFGPVAHHAATETALVAAHKELRDLDEAALGALGASSRRAAEVVRVHRAALAHLSGAWYDEEDLMAAATSTVENGAAPADIGTVIVYLPQRLSRHGAHLLRALGVTAPLTVIAGTTGVPKADSEVARSVARLKMDLGLPSTEPVLPQVVSAEHTQIITASDADDEVRAVVRTVVDAVRSGTALDRIAVLHAAEQPYARLLQHHLDAAAIASNGSATIPVAGRLAGRTLLGLLTLSTSGLRRQDLFTWLSGAPILHDSRWAPVGSWERISRDSGVVAGRDDWDKRLNHFAERQADRADRLEARRIEGDHTNWRIVRARHDGEQALELRAFVLAIDDHLVEATVPAPWADRVRSTKKLMANVMGGSSRRTNWPEAEQRAADRVDLALDRLAVLDDLEGPVTLDVFTRALTVELEGDLGRRGRFGEGVLVGPVSMAVGVNLELTIIVGMAEGTFPSTVRDDSLLPDEDRQAAGGALALRSGHVDRLHHQFLATLSGAQRQVLCIPKGDLRRSRERVPSRWALDVASALAKETWWSDDLLEADAPWLTHHASFDAAVRTARVPATGQEHRLRQLLALDAPRNQLHSIATAVDATFAAGVEALNGRWSAQLTRFDGNLAGLAIPSPTETGASATSLESWAKCPHGYLLRQVLRVEPIEQPEDTLQITPIDRGNLIHQALELFIEDAIATSRIPTPEQSWTDQDHARLAKITSDLCNEAEANGLTGRTLFWHRDRLKILADLDRFLTEDDRHRAATGATPIAAELAFGFGGDAPLPFALTNGRIIELRGKADRVDQTADGALHVLDYKTGAPKTYKGLSATNPHQGGKRLQLAVYAEAARRHAGDSQAPVRSEYWFTSPAGRFAKLGYRVDDSVLNEVSEAMTTIVEGIEAGLFTPHPKPHDTSPFTECDACDPDGLGTTEILRHWDRKLEDPALASYLRLITPPEEAIAP